MTWRELFESSADIDVTVEEIRAVLADHRGQRDA